MSALISLGWFLVGTVFIFAARPFLEVCACFLVAGIFLGVNELSLMRQEMEDWSDE